MSGGTRKHAGHSADMPSEGEAEAGGRSQLYDRVKRALEWPMLLLALAFGVLVVFESVAELSPQRAYACEVAQWAMWSAFLAEYVALLALSPDRRRFVRTHWLDLIVIVCPVARVLRLARALRLLRVLRAGASTGRALIAAKAILGRRDASFVIVGAVGMTFAGAGLMMIAEGPGPFASYGSALWWAFTTVTTVGYGDMTPVTALGRTVAVVLMIVGISVFGVVSASIAAYFVEQSTMGESERLDHIAQELAAIREQLASMGR